MTQFVNTMLDPFETRREVMTPSQLAEAYGSLDTAKNLAYAPRWSVWAAGFGGSQITGSSAFIGSGATTSSVSGTMVGADYALSPQTKAGFALAGGGTYFSSGVGGGRSDLFQAGAFIRQMIRDAYVAAALAYGWQDVSAVSGFDQLHVGSEADAYSSRIETGYRFTMPWLGIAPYAAGQLTRFRLPVDATQALSDPFSAVASTSGVTDSRAELGFRTDKSFSVNEGALTLRGRLAWAHDFNPDRAASALIQTSPGASSSATQAPDSALAIASAELKWLNSWLASVSFQGEFSNTTRSYAGKAFVHYIW